MKRTHAAVAAANGARVAGIRVYDARPAVMFRDKWKSAGPNAEPFPQFDSLPAGAHEAVIEVSAK